MKAGRDVYVGKDGKVRVRSNTVVGKPQKGMVICFSGDTRPTDKLKVFYKDADGTLKPTRKGVSLHREQVGDVIKALSVIERAKTVTP